MDAWPGRLVPDGSLRVLDGGRVLIGGSPLKVLRFTRPIDLDDVRSPTVVDRLVDTGMAHPSPATGPFDASDVTVVIPTYGDPEPVMRSLDALAAGGARIAEVIVVDDASPDPDPISRAVAHGCVGLPIRLVCRSHNGGPAAARNTGLSEVTTPLVAFLDAGCAPEEPVDDGAGRGQTTADGWLGPLLAHFADPTLALVAPRIRSGWYEITKPIPRWRRHATRYVTRSIAEYESLRSPLDLGDLPARVAPTTRVSYVPTACVVARVGALEAIGGFDESLRVGEDVDLVWRLAEARPGWRVRYEPAAEVSQDSRIWPFAFLSRRVVYGTSAAPLARRHPGALAPVRMSPWSAAMWALVAIGHPVAGCTVGAVSTGLLARRLQDLPDPTREALRLAGGGNLAAGRLLADATRRVWWPGAIAALARGPRPLRRAVATAMLVPPLVTWYTEGRRLNPAVWTTLHLADDAAYGLGVWVGCIRERNVGPLIPDLRAGRFTRRNPPADLREHPRTADEV